EELILGFLAGAFIALGGMLTVMGQEGVSLNLPGFIFAGLAPVGILLVVTTGAELFTANGAIMPPATLVGAIRWQKLLRNWLLVYLGNVVGALFGALVLAYGTGIINVNASNPGRALGSAAAALAENKLAAGWGALLLRGVGCGWLLGLGIWAAFVADDLVGKLAGLWLPVIAFMLLGFEHAIANVFFIPLGMMNGAAVGVFQFLWGNLLPVTLGNLVGGAGFVGVLYWWLYARE
ncbi:MAG: formate/nitrite transporter family protein, partial [Chloroflexota bacterium]|nr:formate/nitrite transporter family protein [Chloroflexota bacterium]